MKIEEHAKHTHTHFKRKNGCALHGKPVEMKEFRILAREMRNVGDQIAYRFASHLFYCVCGAFQMALYGHRRTWEI